MTRADLLLPILFVISLSGAAQELQRHVILGFEVAPLAAKTMDAAEVGVVVKSLSTTSGRPTSIFPGDVITSVAGTRINSPEELSSLLRILHPGLSCEVVLRWSGVTMHTNVMLQLAPYETSRDFEILYRAVSVDGSLRRVIVTKPEGHGRFPAILLVGGLGCYSLDNLPADDPYHNIIYGLTRSEYSVMRVEKTGEGDSQGPPCSAPEADLRLEVAGYAAGLKALRSYDFVDPNHVFILAHHQRDLR